VTLRDISVALRPGTPEWPGDTPYDCAWTWRMAAGDSVNVSTISGSPHVGTHADAPLHVRDGWAGAHELPLDAFVGPVWVTDVRGAQQDVALEDLALPTDRAVSRLLLRTGRTIAEGSFPQSWPSLTGPAIAALVARGIRLVGVDCPSVDGRESKTLDNHVALFGGGCCILENLDLRGVASGPYELVAPPLKLEGADAAPVRAILRDLPAT
jgi:arylformamidase